MVIAQRFCSICSRRQESTNSETRIRIRHSYFTSYGIQLTNMRSQIPILFFTLFTLYASASPIAAGPDTALQIQSSLDETMHPIDHDPRVYVTQHGWNDATARLSDVLKGAFRLSSLFTGSSNEAPEKQSKERRLGSEQPQRKIRAARRRRGHP